MSCNPHPMAPHGFVRNASHSADRHVCECAGFEPPRAHEPLLQLLEQAEASDASCYGTLSTATVRKAVLESMETPIDMVLNCPRCGTQHIDAPAKSVTVHSRIQEWANPPHRSHLCGECGWIWRPADVPTNGVAAVTTRGSRDST